MNNNISTNDDPTFAALKEIGNFEIEKFNEDIDLTKDPHFKQINTTNNDQSMVNMFMEQLPLMASSSTMWDSCKVVFPDGLPRTLTALKQGGYGSMLKGADGKFVGTASLYPLQLQAALTGMFSIMSFAVGKHYLSDISAELKLIDMKMDTILNFLYGDKKAELMSEISFMRYAYNNYNSIMQHDQQRLATITSLQNTRKVAMKDIEFYISDLDSTVKTEAKNYNAFIKISEKVFQMKKSLDMSLQLFVTSSIMEVYYSQNYDANYINSIKDETIWFIERYNNLILSAFNRLSGRNDEYNKSKINKVDNSLLNDKITKLMNDFKTGEESPMRKLVISSLDNASGGKEIYIDKKRNIYIKTA